MTFCVTRKKKKKSILPAHTKTNIVRGTMTYNAHIKFELNQKHRLDISVLLII